MGVFKRPAAQNDLMSSAYVDRRYSGGSRLEVYSQCTCGAIISGLDINLCHNSACADGQVGLARRCEFHIEEGSKGRIAAPRRVDCEMRFGATEGGTGRGVDVFYEWEPKLFSDFDQAD